MKENSRRMMKSRLRGLFIIFFVAMSYLLIQVGLITFVDNENFDQRVMYQYVAKQTVSDQVVPKRGQILDRNGIVLAENVRVYNVIYDPNGMIQQPEEVREYSELFLAMRLDDVTTSKLEEIRRLNETAQYWPIARGVELSEIAEISEAIKSGEIKGVYLEDYYKRVYPYDTLASDVIGMYSQATGARYGIEQEYDESLTGIYGRLYGYLDDDAFVKQEEILPTNGYNVNLTIDFTVQKIVEESLQKVMDDYYTDSASAIVMDPQTGEIIAMATYPTFNLNEPYDLSYAHTEEEVELMDQQTMSDAHMWLWNNDTVSMTFEPGSTFKSMTYAACLEEGLVNENTMFYCPGFKIVAGRVIGCWKDGGHGDISAKEALEQSCNVAFMDMGELLGRELLWHYMEMYGIGQKTGLDVISEGGTSPYLYNDYDSLNVVQRATNAFGQGSNMTPIQIISSFTSVVNGGYYYQPHFMQSIVDDSGHYMDTYDEIVSRRIISDETSALVREALVNAVTEGTGSRASVEGYTIGGKTGTAEQGDREDKTYIVSFAGFVEQAGEAKLVAFINIDNPISKEFPDEDVTSRTAAAAFSDIMEDVMPYMGIFPEVIEEDEPVEDESQEDSSEEDSDTTE